MEVKINGNKEDLSAMLVGAVRYALNRQTYIVNWTCEFIANNKHLLIDSDRQVIRRDIKQCKDYVWDCNREDWTKLLKILENK
jgi:hypothetical protein